MTRTFNGTWDDSARNSSNNPYNLCLSSIDASFLVASKNKSDLEPQGQLGKHSVSYAPGKFFLIRGPIMQTSSPRFARYLVRRRASSTNQRVLELGFE
mmetsp:Transcript_4157/g.8007  ORF Transcript_4157/g.8007 Transcript_4157/m.8007 type:complete len:98 (-) Transcript_4157:1471-1764(-)